MKLKELLKTIPDDDWLYIGAASGFVFIGQKHEAKKKLREAEKYYFNAYTGYKHDADARIKNHPQIMEKKQALLAAAKENGDAKEIAKCEHGISNAECKYKTAIESSAKFGEILENYKKFADREILDTYKRKIVEPLGTIVVVEGPEVGQYWLYSEVEK